MEKNLFPGEKNPNHRNKRQCSCYAKTQAKNSYAKTQAQGDQKKTKETNKQKPHEFYDIL